MKRLLPTLVLNAFVMLTPALANPFFFSTGSPDGRMATASRPGGSGQMEIESADDFVLSSATSLTAASFVGLLPSGFSVLGVTVEIYRVFPLDSTVPPDGRVPTRVNSPSDVALDSRDSTAGLSFSTTVLNSSFTAANSVLLGINPFPNQTTGGEGAVSGQEVQFMVNFLNPLLLPADHYFFVPQVQLANGNFLWLVGAETYRCPRDAVCPGSADLDPQCKPGSGLAQGRHRHRRWNDVQCSVFAQRRDPVSAGTCHRGATRPRSCGHGPGRAAQARSSLVRMIDASFLIALNAC